MAAAEMSEATDIMQGIEAELDYLQLAIQQVTQRPSLNLPF